MRPFIALLLLCVMLLSHGSMGEAVPHPGAQDLAHVDAHTAHALTDHHAGASEAADTGDAGDDWSEDPTSHALHAHVVGHLDRLVELSPIPLEASGLKLARWIAQSPPSRDVAPLLEPPSA